ncbi:MAG: 2-oxoglutarate dehydrogenase E1 component, partial [Deltaproteobacteria bacterium]|nr:2-oxoglutarate dehydrogenase E1 component [Deltaproteobacteria bacterium]
AEVPEAWRDLFDRLAGGNGAPIALRGNGHAPPAPQAAARPAEPLPAAAMGAVQSVGIFGLVDAYRTHGHLIADLHPLGGRRTEHAYLDPRNFGLSGPALDARVTCGNFLGLREGTPRELIEALRETYCGTFAVEFMQMRDKVRRDWLVERIEPIRSHPVLEKSQRRSVLRQVMAAERFEQFLHKRFLGQKRFSIEGGEALIPLMEAIVDTAAGLGTKEIVIGMAHRGRLNTLVHTMSMPYRAMFSEFQTGLMPVNVQGSGDVKYHRGYSADRVTPDDRRIHLSLCPNPSHLEAINPVAEGMVRAKQNFRGDLERSEVVAVLMHGDAAFIGQGVVAETLALSELETYWTGGTVHIIVNNRIGYTTDPHDYCFTEYPSDMAKLIEAPIFHVNADDPEACVHAARLAMEFRQEFHEDVVIDMICYRRHGHNEGDDPTYTQPLLYAQIKQHETVTTLYAKRLLGEGAIDEAGVERLESDQHQRLESEMEESLTQVKLTGAEGYHGLWEGLRAAPSAADKTAITRETVEEIADALVGWPGDFNVHPKLRRMLEKRAATLRDREPIDWGLGEALAIGSLLMEGTTVRLTGQDAERGTFGHRHGVLHDVETGSRYVSLAGLAGEGAKFIISNSLLSEFAVLGFEYGYSTVDPARLAIWEAQFGDFANGAQIIIDQFIASAEQKWLRSSGLVMLLPHGYEGQGPEHSSARIERFLQLCADDNMQVVHPTTPAQIFHVLRRQIHRSFRKPLVVMSPKSLLRLPRATSSLDEIENGSFREVIDDPRVESGDLDPARARRVILCTGKVFYTLERVREESAFDDVALLRVEQLHPFPFETLRAILSAYGTRDFLWVQEEPWNMGGWSFVRDRLKRALPKGGRVRYVGRPEASSPAPGSYRQHEAEEAEFVAQAFAKRARRRREDDSA